MNISLYDKTLQLIKNRPAYITLQQIADDLSKDGATVSYSWICKFHNGDIANPAYRTLQALHDYLINVGKQSA